jgi:ABC-type glycerol-3-phosphate transport system substrate-binding protein
MKIALLGTATVGALLLAACSSGGSSSKAAAPSGGLFSKAPSASASTAASPSAPGSAAPASAAAPSAAASGGASSSISGTITYLSHRTDLDKDGTYAKIVAAFNKVYPNVKVNITSDTNYNADTPTKLASGSYPDVLDIPPGTPLASLPTYFLPYGSVADLSPTYNWTAFSAYQDKVYGLGTFGNIGGMVVNSALWSKAGIDVSSSANWPKTPDEFISDLQKVGAANPGVTPYYTNYKDGWPTNWNAAVGSISCSADANNQLANTATPFSPLPGGSDLNTIYTLEYNIVHDKLSEQDPTTTNWENSKTLLATGKISAMYLGSWAVPQMQLAATTANVAPAIAIIPFPYQVNGDWCVVAGPDTNIAVSNKTKSPEAAAAWVEFLVGKADLAASNNALPVLKSGTFPPGLAAFQAPDVKIVTLDQSKATNVSNIDNVSKVGISSQIFPQAIIDDARGAGTGSLQSEFASLNSAWGKAKTQTADGANTH